VSAVGTIHQILLLWAARRMIADGFVIAGFDGYVERGGHLNALPKPFLLRGRRPDAWGATSDGSLVAFAEAKSADDVLSQRTMMQLRIFGAVRMKNGSLPCPLYIAVPREAAPALDKALKAATLLSAGNVIRLHVPEALLRGASHAA
jgi:hypothetical protein